MKKIETFADDVYGLLNPANVHVHNEDHSEEHALNISTAFTKALTREDFNREKGKLWASDLGKKCLRQMWYKFNEPEAGEDLMGHTRFKFLYGNLLEDAVLYLGKEAGHTITHEQELVETEVDGWSIRGRIDAIVDNVTTDVKSTSSYGYKKYSKEGLTPQNDGFGYIEQVSYYHAFGPDTDGAGFIFVDKQNGHIKYIPIQPVDKETLTGKASAIITAVEEPDDTAVPRGYSDVPYGKSGNRSLDIACSYCEFKHRCWPNLKGYVYSHGPVWMTEVKQEPRVPEITDHA